MLDLIKEIGADDFTSHTWHNAECTRARYLRPFDFPAGRQLHFVNPGEASS